MNAIKWHGGKAYLATKIIHCMPRRCTNPNAPNTDDPGWLHYVEPFAGGLSVLLAMDPEGISEVANDLNGQLANFWQCLRNDYRFRHLQKQLEATPFSQSEYNAACERLGQVTGDHYPCVACAANFFISCRQSMAGRMDSFAPLTRNRTRRGMNEQASAWLSAIEGLPEVHARLRRVVILNDDAVKVIRQQDGPRTLFYLDPPYMHETRTAADIYQHEMTGEQHRELLATLAGIKGRFLLSGYRSALYDEIAGRAGWNRVDIEIDNKSGSGKRKQKRTESIWMNY